MIDHPFAGFEPVLPILRFQCLVVVPGEPQAWARATPIMKGGVFIGANDRKNRPAKAMVVDAWREQAAGKCRLLGLPMPWPGPVRCRIRTLHLPPKDCWPGKLMESRPDGSNLLKLVEDALEKIAWSNDSKHFCGAYWKEYCWDDGGARTEILIELFENGARPRRNRKGRTP